MILNLSLKIILQVFKLSFNFKLKRQHKKIFFC